MLRGVNRNVFVVRADKSSRFESVYFVIKKGLVAERADIIKEANRIIAQSGMTGKRERFGRRTVLGFLLGVVSGGLLTAIIGGFYLLLK